MDESNGDLMVDVYNNAIIVGLARTYTYTYKNLRSLTNYINQLLSL